MIAGRTRMIRPLIDFLLVAALALGISACGGSSAGLGGSPTAPSGTSGHPSGAVISGTVIGRPLATQSIGPTLDSPSTLTVTVAGTNITVTVDASGHFEISGVPAGNIELLFRQGSSTWTVTITGVAAEEQIQIQINLSSGTPTVVSQSRTMAKVRLCHKTEANRYQLIDISASAESTHRAHGDAAIGESVPADTTKVFDSNCQAVAPSIRIVKSTNGEDANEAPGPSITVGSTVTWTYVVTNHGLVLLENVGVTDDKGVTVSCPQTSLNAGESMTCTATGLAVVGQYRNVGTASGTAAGATVSHSDPSHYFGEEVEPEGPSGPKVLLCHKRGRAGYILIEVAAAAERAHRAHGDAKIGEPAPLEPGKTFGAGCAVAG
jgi:hypothetical protein